jgi:hypothetical protein
MYHRPYTSYDCYVASGKELLFMPRTKDPSAPTRIKACTSLDELTLTLLEKIRHKFHLSKVDAARMVVGLALEKRIKLAGVTKFHQEVWSNLSFESGQRFSQLRLDWTPEENALLLIFSAPTIGARPCGY